tara:strand:- start:831 stop:1154 length:324 start_codon:yes stop_codon:yes gene_type:complete
LQNLKLSKKLNKNNSLINSPTRRSKEKPNSSKTLSLRPELLMLRRKDNKKKFLLKRELPNSRNFKRKKPSKNLKPRRRNKSSSLPKLFKRPKLPPPRKPLLKPTSPE